MVFEVDSTFSIIWEWLAIYQQELIFDLSLIQIKPFFAQLTIPDTIYQEPDHWFYNEKKTCYGLYQELRILPITFKLGANFKNCYLSVIKALILGEEIEKWCKFDPEKRMHSEKILFW